MNRKEIHENLIDVILEMHCHLNESDIKEDSNFIDDLGADSLDRVELIMAIEEVFDVDINDDDAEKVVKVKDAIDLIEISLK